MNKQININGIRLNKNYIQITQNAFDIQDKSSVPLYKALESNRINMVFMTLNTMGKRPFVSGAIASKYFGQSGYKEGCRSHQDTCILSIYPHHYRLKLLGFLLSILGQEKLPFQYMTSSNAMLTFAVDQENCDGFIKMLSANFNLPESHVPFEQEENDELTQFLKKKYPETRATYVEEKIKTYGMTLMSGLTLNSYLYFFGQLAGFGEKIRSMEEKKDTFFYTSAHMTTSGQIHLFLLTKKSLDAPLHKTPAELLSFHGPHFGDRHSIISRAMNCLSQNVIPVLQAGCTGSSISIVLPQGYGGAAKQALTDVFQGP